MCRVQRIVNIAHRLADAIGLQCVPCIYRARRYSIYFIYRTTALCGLLCVQLARGSSMNYSDKEDDCVAGKIQSGQIAKYVCKNTGACVMYNVADSVDTCKYFSPMLCTIRSFDRFSPSYYTTLVSCRREITNDEITILLLYMPMKLAENTTRVYMIVFTI